MVLKIQKKGKYLIKVHVGYPETDIPAMFTAMSTKRAEPLVGIGNKYNNIAVVTKEIEGDTLRDILLGNHKHGIDKEYLYKHIEHIVDQLAEITADLYLSGSIHGDIGTHNIIVTKDKEGKPKLWLIDFETAQMADALSNIQKDYDYMNAYVLERLARSIDEERELKKKFEERFEEYITKAKGEPIKNNALKGVKFEKGEVSTSVPLVVRRKDVIIHFPTGKGYYMEERRNYGGRKLIEEVAKRLKIDSEGKSTEELMHEINKKGVKIQYGYNYRGFKEKGNKIIPEDEPTEV